MSSIQFPADSDPMALGLAAQGGDAVKARIGSRTGEIRTAADIEALKGRSTLLEKKDLLYAAREFESFFLFKLLQAMRKTVPENKMFHGGRFEEVFRDFYDEEITKQMSKSGGIGLADMLYKELGRTLENTYTPQQVLENYKDVGARPAPVPERSVEESTE